MITVHIGNAFDVVSERKQTDFKKIASNVYEMEFEITLRNHKDTAITVEANVETVQTATSTMGTTVTGNSITSLPLSSNRSCPATWRSPHWQSCGSW